MTSDRPRLRPGLTAAPEDAGQSTFLVGDQFRLSKVAVRISAFELECLRLFDGGRTLHDMQMEAIGWTGGQIVPLQIFENLARRFDEAMFLDGPRWQAAAGSDVRPPSCVGCYPAHAEEIRKQFRQLFKARGASGLPGPTRPDASLRAALLPHIDFARGGKTYTWAFKEIVERSPASLFVIIGTSHYSRQRFSLTRKNFQTPLGIVPTDRQYINQLVARYGDGLFDDELMAHLPEHSIELEVVLLQYLYENRRPIRIVPLVVGSFEDAVLLQVDPQGIEDIGRMIEALRAVERDTPEPICYLISGDLAHIGPKFGDEQPVSEPQLRQSLEQDRALLDATTAADPKAYFRVIAEEGDARRICGLPPTYAVLQALAPNGGRVLHYEQYVHPQGFESVSFASAVFHR